MTRREAQDATGRRGGFAATSAVLFLCLFASQAGMIAVSPVLADVARELDVSTAAAGQLRTVSGLTAAATALVLGRVGRHLGLGAQLVAGAALLALGSLGSALAPSFPILALAQAPVGAGVALLTTAGAVAAAEWVAPEKRTAALSWTMAGHPAAWIVGMPLIGAAGARSWRLGWLLPLAAAAAVAFLLARRVREPPAERPPATLRRALADPVLARWLAAEVLSNTAWAATLVYAGALLAESYSASTELIGLALAVAAAVFVTGNLAARRYTGRGTYNLLVALAPALATGDMLFGAVRPSLLVSTLLFSATAFAAGARSLLSGVFAASVGAALRPAVMSARTASMQIGYFVGSLAGGTALGLGGYPALGLVTGGLFLAAGSVIATRALPRVAPA